MTIDPLRHVTVFPPSAFGDKRVDIIGCGATGSRIILSLAKLGVTNIHAWDFDSVEEHNIANQDYGLAELGMQKTDAIAQVVKRDTGLTISTHAERVDGSQELGEVVFLLTDTMASRKTIWEQGLRYRFQTSLVIETRMGADNGRVYAVNPKRRDHVVLYEETLYSDEEAEVSACGAAVSVGPTADVIAGLAVWQMIRWFAVERGEKDVLENELIFSLASTAFLSRTF